MAGIQFPSWAYNTAGQASQIVASQAAFNALGPPGTWQLTPVITAPPQPVPADPGFGVTDTRLQQSLIEARVTNLLLLQLNAGGPDTVDLQGLRQDVLSQDSSLTT